MLATGPAAPLSKPLGRRARRGRWPRVLARRIEGCKRQATDLLARDFYSLSLPTPDRRGLVSLDGDVRFGFEDAENFFAGRPRSCEKDTLGTRRAIRIIRV